MIVLGIFCGVEYDCIFEFVLLSELFLFFLFGDWNYGCVDWDLEIEKVIFVRIEMV